MIAYLDSSVLLRVLLNQPDPFPDFKQIQRFISSKLIRTECLRALDRLRVQQRLSTDEYLASIEELYEALESIELIELSDAILNRAAGSFPIALGTLDAIHLSSALAFGQSPRAFFLTHDQTLGQAARASGFEVFGCN